MRNPARRSETRNLPQLMLKRLSDTGLSHAVDADRQ